MVHPTSKPQDTESLNATCGPNEVSDSNDADESSQHCSEDLDENDKENLLLAAEFTPLSTLSSLAFDIAYGPSSNKEHASQDEDLDYAWKPSWAKLGVDW